MPLLNWMSEHSLLSIVICIFLIISMAFLAPLFRSKKTIIKIQEKNTFPYNYKFPDIVLKRWKAKYPQLNEGDFKLAQKALMQFFEVLYYNKTSVAMVSEIADELWHEFILHTKEYHDFCNHTFGKYIHHSPNENSIEYDWRQKDIPNEMLNLYKFSRNSPYNIPKNIPLIFIIDKHLNIENGYKFHLSNIEKQYQELLVTEKKKEDDKSSSCSSSSCSGCGD